MKKYAAAVAVAILLAFAAFSNPIKTWVSGDIITASDINANFSHIHNLMVGGHGPRLVDADVSDWAGISFTKLESYYPIARGFGTFACTPTCTIGSNQYGFTSVSGSVTSGGATFTMSPNPECSDVITAVVSTGTIVTCYVQNATTTTFKVYCSGSPLTVLVTAFCL